MAKKCQIRWCKSGKPATVEAIENIGDGAYRITICKPCAKALNLSGCNDLPEAYKVERILRKVYKPTTQPEGK